MLHHNTTEPNGSVLLQNNWTEVGKKKPKNQQPKSCPKTQVLCAQQAAQHPACTGRAAQLSSQHSPLQPQLLPAQSFEKSSWGGKGSPSQVAQGHHALGGAEPSARLVSKLLLVGNTAGR